jgi:hypothetical protein
LGEQQKENLTFGPKAAPFALAFSKRKNQGKARRGIGSYFRGAHRRTSKAIGRPTKNT